MKVKLVKIESLSSNIQSFWFEKPQDFNYTAGQYIEMTLPHDQPDERGIRHWFTLSSSPTEKLLAITTKFSKPGSSFKRTLANLVLGDKIDISQPMGDFVLPVNPRLPLVFTAGGMGITPFRSIIKFLIDTRETRNIQIILAASKPEDLLFENIMQKYDVKVIRILSQPPRNWKEESGLLSAQRILELTKTSPETLYFVSGPEQMVESLEKQFYNLDLEKSRFVGDFFPGYPPI